MTYYNLPYLPAPDGHTSSLLSAGDLVTGMLVTKVIRQLANRSCLVDQRDLIALGAHLILCEQGFFPDDNIKREPSVGSDYYRSTSVESRFYTQLYDALVRNSFATKPIREFNACVYEMWEDHVRRPLYDPSWQPGISPIPLSHLGKPLWPTAQWVPPRSYLHLLRNLGAVQPVWRFTVPPNRTFKLVGPDDPDWEAANHWAAQDSAPPQISPMKVFIPTPEDESDQD